MVWWPRGGFAALSKGRQCLFSSAILGCINQLDKIEYGVFFWGMNKRRAVQGDTRMKENCVQASIFRGLACW